MFLSKIKYTQIEWALGVTESSVTEQTVIVTGGSEGYTTLVYSGMIRFLNDKIDAIINQKKKNKFLFKTKRESESETAVFLPVST